MVATTPLLSEPSPSASTGPLASLLVVDPELGASLEPEQAAVVRRRLLVPLLVVEPGSWQPGTDGGADEAFAYVVVEGLLRREAALHDRRATELFGPGDAIDARAVADGSVPISLRWAADERAVLAVLDARFTTAARYWPALGLELHRRMAAQAARTSVLLAIAQLGRVDLRVLAVLWHLADRWGVVTSGGVVVPLRLTHALLGRLVGAQRPTVTLALSQLGETGDVVRRDDGAFVLRHGSADRLLPVDHGWAAATRGASFCPTRTKAATALA